MRMFCEEYHLDCIFEEDKVMELLIESPVLFQDFIVNLRLQYEGKGEFAIFSEAGKEIDLAKKAEMITDPLQMDINNRKILSKIYQEIVKTQQDTNLEKMMQIQSLLEQFVLEACEESQYALTYHSNIDFSDILKVFDVHVDYEEMDLVSRMIAYIRMMHRVLNISLFVFVNIKAYFSDDILEALYQTLSYENVYILLIERYESTFINKEKRVILDKDACVICDNDR